jgi:hypothetical protein
MIPLMALPYLDSVHEPCRRRSETMTNEQDCQERLSKARELGLHFICELGSGTGERERNIKAMDRILDLTEANHDRSSEKVHGEEEREAEGYERDKRRESLSPGGHA